MEEDGLLSSKLGTGRMAVRDRHATRQGIPSQSVQAAEPELPPTPASSHLDRRAALEGDMAEGVADQTLRSHRPAPETPVAGPRPTVQGAPADQLPVQQAPMQRTAHEPVGQAPDTGAGRERASPARSSRRQGTSVASDAPLVGPPLPVPTLAAAPEPATVQYTIDSREALRQALQPRLVPSAVQAAPEDAGTQTASAAGPGGEKGGEDAPEEQDIESLARDVYRILRHRLLVERERELGRR